jgi:RNA polymerase sigma-70 factor (ECF subfamily)
MRLDLAAAFAGLRARERALLWLAYAQGASHKEIAEVIGVGTGSVKALLLRARRRLAGLLDRREAAR